MNSTERLIKLISPYTRTTRDILKRTGKVTAIEVKNAFQGIATAQKTLLVLFGEMMEDFKGRIGIDRAQSTYKQYEVLNKQA